jgi:hypothetical protein
LDKLFLTSLRGSSQRSDKETSVSTEAGVNLKTLSKTLFCFVFILAGACSPTGGGGGDDSSETDDSEVGVPLEDIPERVAKRCVLKPAACCAGELDPDKFLGQAWCISYCGKSKNGTTDLACRDHCKKNPTFPECKRQCETYSYPGCPKSEEDPQPNPETPKPSVPAPPAPPPPPSESEPPTGDTASKLEKADAEDKRE